MLTTARQLLIASLLFPVLLTGCASQPNSPAESWLRLDQEIIPRSSTEEEGQTSSAGSSGVEAALQQPPEASVDRRRVPAISNDRPGQAGLEAEERPEFADEAISVTLPPQPLPAFINAVFGEILERPYSIGPAVSERTDLISLRSVREMSPETFLSLVEEALKDYGVGVQYEDGLFRIIELSELRAQMPRFITSRARRDVPTGLRPVVQFVELTAIDAIDMQAILEQAFPNRDELTIRTNRVTNALVISGLADDVNAALAIVEEMDELRYAGRLVITYTPESWEASELANSMQEILTLEGFSVGVGTTTPRAITLLPLDFTNQLMIFAPTRDQAEYVLGLASRLDEEAFRGEAVTAHVYDVQNADAQTLAEIVSSAMGQAGRASAPSGGGNGSSTSTGEGGGAAESGTVVSAGDLTVDAQGNRIVYLGTHSEYETIETLLRRLDTPIPEILIEVTIAEITLNDDSNYGLDIIFDSELAPTFAASLSSSNGISAVVDTGQVTLDGSAGASSTQINILSTPRIVTRSGTEASVQVGNDVPIITTQRASESQSGGNTDFLQQVQYRSTGILLSVEPRVFSGNRIDLKISQELSAAQPNDSSEISSPIISNRSLVSQLSLQDGQTAVLGGLIENRFTRNHSGIPFLKDLPVLGAPFRNETLSATRTMLVVLVTPYILDTRSDRQMVVDALIGSINDGFDAQRGRSRTLLPPSEPLEINPATVTTGTR